MHHDDNNGSSSMAGLQFGTVSDIQCSAGKLPRVRVRLPLFNNLRTWWLPVLHTATLKNKFFHMPDIGEHVAVLMTDDENGLVLGAVYSDADPPPLLNKDIFHIRFADGTILEYDRALHHLTANVAGDVLMQSSGVINISSKGNVQVVSQGRATVQASGGIKLAGAVDIDGPLHVSGKMTIDSDLVSLGKITDSDGDGGA
jgi:phage baseplate assembly protein V